MTVLRGKRVLVTLTLLMLAALPLMEAMTQTVQAQQYLFTINLVVAYETGTGYWDIAGAFKTELAKIGINVELHYMDTGTYYDVVWDTGWNKTWDQGGWDMDLGEFWWMPTDLVWFEGCYSWAGHPPYGWNYFGWHNDGADRLLRSCLTTVDPELRKEYIWGWQEEFMHDPPHASTFYRIMYEVTAADLEGWNLVSWWYAASELKRTGTKPEDDVTVKFGSASDLIGFNPVFMVGEASEALCNQIYDLLMTTRVDPITGAAIVVPALAREYPVYSPDGKTVTVYLRNDVYWHDGWKFNATDVKFTFDAVIDPATGSTGYGDFSAVIDSVEIKDAYTVVFHLKEPCAYFNALLANDFGGLIIPEHILRGVPHKDWKRHATNTVAPMVGTGPFKFVEWVRDVHWLVEANKNYFLGEPLVDRIYNLIITDPATGLIALQTHQIDFGDCWAATIDEINEMRNDPTLKVTEESTPRVYFFAFNLHHPILSNRYVRQAIAHAIPYEHIITNLLPALGFGGIRATGPVTPLHGYLYNSELKPYEYDLAKAKLYLDMWKYSQVNSDYTLGPVGDGDFSGFVEMADFVVWADRIVEGQLTPGTWPFVSGRPIDPDYDNSGYVEMADFYRWRENIGEYYPFYGAR